jgi:hypothetical protein
MLITIPQHLGDTFGRILGDGIDRSTWVSSRVSRDTCPFQCREDFSTVDTFRMEYAAPNEIGSVGCKLMRWGILLALSIYLRSRIRIMRLVLIIER